MAEETQAAAGIDVPASWWRDGVLYQIYPRSFADSDGDGIGDLRGITARLDHLEWLGIDGIWLNPTMPSPNEDWGYDVADYCAVHFAPPRASERSQSARCQRGGGIQATGHHSAGNPPTEANLSSWLRTAGSERSSISC